jgi:hypothetical protein
MCTCLSAVQHAGSGRGMMCVCVCVFVCVRARERVACRVTYVTEVTICASDDPRLRDGCVMAQTKGEHAAASMSTTRTW